MENIDGRHHGSETADLNIGVSKPVVHTQQLTRTNSNESLLALTSTNQNMPNIQGHAILVSGTSHEPTPVLIQGSQQVNPNRMVQPRMVDIPQGQPTHMNTGTPIRPPVMPPNTGSSNPPRVPIGFVERAPQIFTAKSRFEGDNKGLQKMHEPGEPTNYENYQVCSGKCSGWIGTYLPCLCCCSNPYQRVQEGYSGIITRFGKFYKLVGPGLHYLIPELDQLSLIDKREKVSQLKQQNVVTLDNASLTIDAILYYKIVNSYKSKFAAVNLTESIQDLGITTLRNVVGKMTVQQFLELQDHLAEQIEAEIAHVAATWGVKVMRLLVQDVFLPQQFRKTFSTGAVAKRISEAQVINSKADVQVAKLLKDASDALNTDAAFQIRYIDALENIAKNPNPKMIFFPADYQHVGTANADLL